MPRGKKNQKGGIWGKQKNKEQLKVPRATGQIQPPGPRREPEGGKRKRWEGNNSRFTSWNVNEGGKREEGKGKMRREKNN